VFILEIPDIRNIIDLVNNRLTTILITTPRLKVTAKPLIGPVPNLYNAAAVIKVVTLESTIVLNAFLKPYPIAILGDLDFIISSFILQK